MRRLDCRLAERLVADLQGERKAEVLARSNLVTLSALCRPHQCVGVENDSEACLFNGPPFPVGKENLIHMIFFVTVRQMGIKGI